MNKIIQAVNKKVALFKHNRHEQSQVYLNNLGHLFVSASKI